MVGEKTVVEDGPDKKVGKENKRDEWHGEWEESEFGGTVEVEEVVDNKEDTVSQLSGESKRTKALIPWKV
jgi:hypothetical protein